MRGFSTISAPSPSPEVVQGVDALRVAAGLVGRLYERAAQLDGPRKVFAAEPVAEAEVVLGREVSRVLRRADNEAVSADDLLGGRIPDDELVVSVLGQILPVDVDLLARAASGARKTSSRSLPTSRMSAGSSAAAEMIYLVAGPLRVADLPLGGQFRAEQGPVYGRQDRSCTFCCIARAKYQFSGFRRCGRPDFPKIRFLRTSSTCSRNRPAVLELRHGDRFTDDDAEMPAFLREHLVGQPQHFDVETDAQSLADAVHVVEEVRQTAFDEDRHDLPLRSVGLLQEAGLPLRVGHHAVDAPGAEPRREGEDRQFAEELLVELAGIGRVL